MIASDSLKQFRHSGIVTPKALWCVLKYLSESDCPRTATDIATALGITREELTMLLLKLHGHVLIVDRAISITDSGRKMLESAEAAKRV